MQRNLSRLLWFIGIWAAGVLTVTIIGYGIKLIIAP